MPSIQVRPFRRTDRDQLTQLVNAHAGAVVPGMSVSVNTVLGSLERQPGEFIEDPWVSERVTLVAEQQNRVAAAAHLLRHYPDERAGQAARDVGEVRWLLYWPHAPAGNPCWPDAGDAAAALMTACLHQLGAWRVTRQHADGELPVAGVYGVPEQWPHIRSCRPWASASSPALSGAGAGPARPRRRPRTCAGHRARGHRGRRGRRRAGGRGG